MKILFIASRFPLPAVKGDQARVLNFLKHLSVSHEIYFVCTAETTPSKSDLDEIKSLTKQLYVIGLTKKEQYWSILTGFLTFTPLEVLFFRSKDAQSTISQIIRDQKIDVVFCQMIRTAHYVKKISLPKVIDFQDAYSVNMMRRFKSERGLVRWVAFLEWQLMKRYEKKMLSKFDFVTIVSDHDRRAIGNAKNIKILPIGVTPFKIKKTRIKNQIIFTGNLRYFPNRDAATWFAREVFPLVRKKVKGATLVIAGSTPPADVLALSKLKGVEVVANPVDLRPYLAQATLAVAPMRSGSGTQFKVIEALSLSTPVLVSKTARYGLDFLSDKALVTCDTNEKKFANKVIWLLNNPKKLQSLAKLGRTEVEKSYLWTSITKRLEGLLTLAAKQGNQSENF